MGKITKKMMTAVCCVGVLALGCVGLAQAGAQEETGGSWGGWEKSPFAGDKGRAAMRPAPLGNFISTRVAALEF